MAELGEVLLEDLKLYIPEMFWACCNQLIITEWLLSLVPLVITSALKLRYASWLLFTAYKDTGVCFSAEFCFQNNVHQLTDFVHVPFCRKILRKCRNALKCDMMIDSGIALCC